ncbi:MAG: LysM domain-containing protein [Verrucomicrobiota bacterium]
MRTIQNLALIASFVTLASCGLGGNDENYDTAGGYDTSDPYGLPDSGGTESASYEAINPPAGNPTYGAAAYEDTAPPPAPTPVPATASTHTVVKGDTVWGLSQKYNVSQADIRAANGMAANDNNIRLGQSINIPAR